MKSIITMLALLFLFVWTFSAVAADEKQVKKEKKIWVQKLERKAGLGIMITNTDHDTKIAGEVKEGGRIVEVFENSEAANIGLQKNDVIVEANGKSIIKPSDLMDIMKDAEEGQEINIVVRRAGDKKSFTATLKPFEGRPYAFHVDEKDGDVLIDVFRTPGDANNEIKILRSGDLNFTANQKGGYLGVQVKDLSDQLKEYFEVKHGVLVEEVIKDSPAEQAGLSAGDIIVAINERKIEDPQDLVRTVNFYNPEESVNIKYVRKGDETDVNTTLGKKPSYYSRIKKMKHPKEINIITEDGPEHLFISEDGDVKKIQVHEEGSDVSVDVEKEFLIL
jgi:C-terminal processing protease CtpA/Prc